MMARMSKYCLNELRLFVITVKCVYAGYLKTIQPYKRFAVPPHPYGRLPRYTSVECYQRSAHIRSSTLQTRKPKVIKIFFDSQDKTTLKAKNFYVKITRNIDLHCSKVQSTTRALEQYLSRISEFLYTTIVRGEVSFNTLT